MKFFIFVSLFSSTFAFADFTCTVYNGVKSVNFSQSGETFHVNCSNGTRVSYSASYKKLSEMHTRVVKEIKLQKVADESSWQDMPKTLKATQNYSGETIKLFGLPIGDVTFSPEHCGIVL